jgi:uncharacterized protein (TIGR03083 family)
MPTVDMPDADSYAATRQRVLAMLEGLSEEQAALPVPACPGWSVHDVLAHLTGIAADAVAGRLEGVGTAGWTAAQLDARRSHTMAEVAAEWRDLAGAFDEMIRPQPALAMAAGADAVVHEHDAAQALGVVADRSSTAVREAAHRYAELFCQRVQAAGLGPVTIESTEGDCFAARQPGCSAGVRAPAYDLLLTFAGRRTLDEARSLGWVGDAAAVLGLLSPYGDLPARPLALRA